MKVNSTPVISFLTGITLMLAILLFEIFFHMAAGTAAYVLVSLLMLWYMRTSKFIVFAGIVSSLFLLGIFLFHFINSETDTTLTTNRIMSLLAVWVAVLFTLHFRKLYQEERREKVRLKALVENAGEGILLVDAREKIMVANPAAEKIFGYSNDELLGKTVDDLIPRQHSQSHSKYVQNFLADPGTRPMGRKLKGVKKDGSEFYIDISLSHFYEGPKLVVIAFILDATDRIDHEKLIQANLKMMSDYSQELEMKVRQRTAQLESANQELVKSQALYHSIASNFPDGFIGVMNRDLKYILVDGKGLHELGLSPVSILGDRVFDSIHGAITSYAEGALIKVFLGEVVSFDIEITGKYYNVSAVPIEERDSSINEILVVVKNVSAQKSLERELVKTLAKEKQLNTLKSRFVTMASHEFRTPLTTILSSAFLLENYTGQQLETEKRKHLDRIKRSVHGLTDLLNDFLSLDKLEEGIIQVSQKPVYLKQFVEDILQEISLIKKEDQKVVFEWCGSEAAVLMDKQLVRNILLNLLSNAIKYSAASGTIGLTISITTKNIKFKVSDQGIGIPEEDQQFVFNRFFRASNTSEIQGTGLGLNIVKRYVKLLKGKVQFQSRLNKGTIFTVTLPLQHVES
jgi:PAS domain S-box-containing protein